MFENDNILRFARSEVGRFIDTDRLSPFKPKIEPLRGLSSGEDIRPNKLPMGGGGGSYGGGGSAIAPSFESNSFNFPSFGKEQGDEKEEREKPPNERDDYEEDSERQLVGVNYGHFGSGKIYNYYGYKLRRGQNVTVWVNHWKSGKLYKTLATVRTTTKRYGQNAISALENRGIGIKMIGENEETSLPGYYKGWKKDAKARYDLKINQLLGG